MSKEFLASLNKMNTTKDSSMLLNAEEKKKSLKEQIHTLIPLVDELKACKTWQDKSDVLNAFNGVKDFLTSPSFIRTFLGGLSIECEVAIKSVIAIGQAPHVFSFPKGMPNSIQRLRELIEVLLSLEQFYAELGGIVGYHTMMLRFLFENESSPPSFSNSTFHQAPGFDISEKTPEVKKMVRWGIESMEHMAEIYPLGGAADRLRLFDPQTKIALPAAKLLFLGKTLLEGIIEDLQAREYLYYKLFKKQLCTPVAMMTSTEKDNHANILAICEEKEWFGRSKESFFFIRQTSVPTINKTGKWCLQGPLQLLLKPGGHGVIWKLAKDQGGFDWLFKQNKTKALVRQINNPLASCDFGLFAFFGLGYRLNKSFGFASCPRFVKASEGMNILIEKAMGGRYEYVLTNIEYCDFARYRLVDEPVQQGVHFSKFSSNTNILFVDLKTILEAVSICPIPGMLINLKKFSIKDENGESKEEEIARLESTMQNIADALVESYDHPLEEKDKKELKTFLTYNRRHKTISAIKREYVEGSSFLETPEGCFLDIQKNAQELLQDYCHCKLPENAGFFSYKDRFPFLFFYHPALGPIYSVIAQKLRNSSLKRGSELHLEITELDIEALTVDGSLIIQAEKIMGHEDPHTKNLCYSESVGKCVLKNVRVINEGIDWSANNIFWKKEIFRKGCCRILIQGNGEFHAEDIILEGDYFVVVESGTRVIAYQEEGILKFKREFLTQPSWWWEYSFDEEDEIILKKHLK